MLVSRRVPLSSSTVSSVVIVMAPTIVIPIFVEVVLSASSVVMVRPVIRVTLLSAIVSVCCVGMGVLSALTLRGRCILVPLGARRLVESVIM